MAPKRRPRTVHELNELAAATARDRAEEIQARLVERLPVACRRAEMRITMSAAALSSVFVLSLLCCS